MRLEFSINLLNFLHRTLVRISLVESVDVRPQSGILFSRQAGPSLPCFQRKRHHDVGRSQGLPTQKIAAVWTCLQLALQELVMRFEIRLQVQGRDFSRDSACDGLDEEGN